MNIELFTPKKILEKISEERILKRLYVLEQIYEDLKTDWLIK